jgi:hypothetical protein
MKELSPARSDFERQQTMYALKGIAVDAFGVPLAAEDRASSECRSIPITEEILREDEVRREAIEVRREGITWRRPDPLPETAYRPKATQPKVRQPKPMKLKAHKEKPPMPTPPEAPSPKLCAVASCNALIRASSKTGRCSSHYFVAKGIAMRDGSSWSGTPAAKPAKKGKKTQPAKHVSASKALPAKEAITVAAPGLVLLPVPEASLDAFLSRLPIEDKIRIVAAEMQR